MAAPVVLHVTRPYDSEEAYLAAEAWTIDARGMLLVGQPSYEPETTIVFDVALANGKKVLRAEGRVVNHLPASDDRPGGLRVRFRRFAAQTKAFIDRAIAARGQRLASGVSSHPPPASFRPPVSVRPPASVRPPPSVRPKRHSAPPLAAVEAQQAEASAVAVGATRERSGIHSRPGTPVAPPLNRDELLLRLRERRRETPDEDAVQGMGSGTGAG